MKSIIILAMLVVGFASCDTPSTATGNTDMQSDSSSSTTNSTMSTDTSRTGTTGTTGTSSDTTTTKKDTLPK